MLYNEEGEKKNEKMNYIKKKMRRRMHIRIIFRKRK